VLEQATREVAADAQDGTSARRELLRKLHGRGLRAHAARGMIVNSGFDIALAALGLVRALLLAHFMQRADYGVFGILVITIGMIVALKNVGVGDKYLQQDEHDQERAFQKAFTLEAMLTAATFTVGLIVLPVMAIGYGDSSLLPAGLAILMVLPANVLQSPMWVFGRNMEFVRQRLLIAVDPVVGFVVAIAMAAAGFGYWALIGGILAGAWSSAAVSVCLSRYPLRFRYDRGTLRSYWSFSWPLFLNVSSGVVTGQAAIIATNASVGLPGVGVVGMASSITTFSRSVDSIVSGTLYPAVCAVKDQVRLLHESFIKSNRLALMWAAPFGAALMLFAGDIVQFGIGERWAPTIPLLRVYGAVVIVGHVAYNWDLYMRAMNTTRPIAVANIAGMVAFLAVGVPLILTHGLIGVAIGTAAMTAVIQVCRGIYLRQVFKGYTWSRQALRATLPTVPAAGVVVALRLLERGPRTLPMVAGEVFAYLVVTAFATWALERQLLREAVSYLVARRSVASA
jgi:PST family polysaccharide transporter